MRVFRCVGAGNGNRTRNLSLGSSRDTFSPYPPGRRFRYEIHVRRSRGKASRDHVSGTPASAAAATVIARPIAAAGVEADMRQGHDPAQFREGIGFVRNRIGGNEMLLELGLDR